MAFTIINNKTFHTFKAILYYGILNKINCCLNNKNENKYSLEYFYFNFNSEFELPHFHAEEVGGSNYKIYDSDVFNNKTRKRFIIINLPNNKYTEIYDIKKNEINEENKSKEGKKLEKMLNLAEYDDKGNKDNKYLFPLE